MAALRNLVTAILCLARHARIAATLRNHASGPAGPPDDHELLTTCWSPGTFSMVARSGDELRAMRSSA
jgi:hypothetical protein